MKLSEKAEEILESMWVQIHELHRDSCDANLIANDPAMRELVARGYVRLEHHAATLTDKGTDEARQCIRRHRLAERLLSDVLHVRKPLLNETSCTFEHLLHQGIDESICTLLGHPRTCPHGKPIPNGKCCGESRDTAQQVILPLSELQPGTHCVVAYLHTANHPVLQKLIAIGLLPSTSVELLQRSPTLVIQMGRSQFAIDHELASHVYVRPS